MIGRIQVFIPHYLKYKHEIYIKMKEQNEKNQTAFYSFLAKYIL